MRQNKETVKRLSNLRRSVALALVLSSGAAASNAKLILTDPKLISEEYYDNAYGGYSAQSGTAVTGNSLDTRQPQRSPGQDGKWVHASRGGRYRVRTCDPYHVKVVLYR